MFLVNFLLFLLTIFLCGYYYVKRKYSVWRDNNVPYDTPVFPYGNGPYLGRRYHVFELVEKYYKQAKDKSKVFGLYIMFMPIAIITDLGLVKSILVKDFNYFTDRGMFYNEKKDPISGHLFNLEGKKWKELRAKITPTFTSGRLRMLFPSIKEIVGRLENIFDKENGCDVEIKDIFARFTTDIIGVCAFGIECDSLQNPNNEFLNIGRNIFSHGRNLLYFTILSFKKLINITGLIRISKKTSNFYMDIVKDTIEYREKNNVQKNDFVNLLMQLKDNGHLDGETVKTGYLTFNEIAAQAFVFFVAGFETSSSTLSFCLYELITNPDIQDKARKHINKVLDNGKKPLTYDLLNELDYIEMVLNETMRKDPVGTSIWRETSEDYKIENTNMTLPKHSIIHIPIYAIHHDPANYPKPKVFDPERFTKEEVGKRPFGSFIPFGDGPRVCIGMRFAMMQMKITLTMLLMRYKFSVCSKTEVPLTYSKGHFTLCPTSGEIWLHQRKLPYF